MGLLADGQHLRLVRGVAQQAVSEAVPPQPDLGDPLNDARPPPVAASASSTGRPASCRSGSSSNSAPERGGQLRHAQVDARSPQPGREDLVDAGREHLAGVAR